MALHGVLSALREILLLQPPLPFTVDERTTYFAGVFPELSEYERIDLAKIDPANFKKYSNSIMYGAWDVIETHLPRTIRSFKEAWRAVYHKEVVGKEVVSELQKITPWHGARTESLLRSFQSYLVFKSQDEGERGATLLAVAPELIDLAELEIATLQMKRAKNETFPAEHSEALVLTEALSFGELLSALFVVPHCITKRSFEWDVLPKEEESPMPLLRNVHGLCIRGSDFKVRWHEVSLREAALIQPGMVISGEECALRFLRVYDGEFRDERSGSEAFLRFVVEMNRRGALQLRTPLATNKVLDSDNNIGIAV